MMGTRILRRACLAVAALAVGQAAHAGARQPVVAPPGFHVVQSGGVMMLERDGTVAPLAGPQPEVDVVDGVAGPVLVLRNQAVPAVASRPTPVVTLLPNGARELRLPDARDPPASRPVRRAAVPVSQMAPGGLPEPDVLYSNELPAAPASR